MAYFFFKLLNMNNNYKSWYVEFLYLFTPNLNTQCQCIFHIFPAKNSKLAQITYDFKK